ncbi:MAG TPA: hypothetical protein GX497_01910 [Bacillus bacterium]|nr:hypothetical protein [Bacillus sp. (in: firmicutes)]
MLFKNSSKEKTVVNTDDLEKQILRINALEVHIKKLLEFEKQFRLSMYKSGSNEGETVGKEELRTIIDRLLSEKLAAFVEKEEKMYERIRTLENQISAMMECSEGKHVKFCTEVNARISALENHFVLVNEVQAVLVKRVDELMEKCNELMNEKETDFKCLYIDKLYLDKYEQNNNFAQLGIKTLSGALNIGATYGKVDIPREVSEEEKDEMTELKAEKEKMKNDTANTNPDSMGEDDEFPYTDIIIEED